MLFFSEMLYFNLDIGNSLRKGSQTTAAPLPATHGAPHTFKPFTTTTEFVSTTPKKTTTSTTIAPMTFTKVTTVTVAKPLIAVHKVRDLGEWNEKTFTI